MNDPISSAEGNPEYDINWWLQLSPYEFISSLISELRTDIYEMEAKIRIDETREQQGLALVTESQSDSRKQQDATRAKRFKTLIDIAGEYIAQENRRRHNAQNTSSDADTTKNGAPTG
jgi:hypothetical protein